MDSSGDHARGDPFIPRRSPRHNNAQTDQEENKEEKDSDSNKNEGNKTEDIAEDRGDQTDQKENKEEKEDSDSNKDEGNETTPEDRCGRAQTDQEGNKEEKDSDSNKNEGNKTEDIVEDRGAQTDQEENKEEKEDSDSNKDEGNKTRPEDIGGRGKGRGEEEDFDREEKEDATTIETENIDEKTAQEENKEKEDSGSNKDEGNKTTPEDIGGRGKGIGLMAIPLVVGIIAVLVYPYVFSAVSPSKHKSARIDIFLRELKTVQTQFPGQRPEVWRRSRIHLERHLKTAQPTEPVSLILTAGRGAERTLHCLARHLASSFSTALNASVLHIDGASKAQQDSDQVKLDIDSQLRGAFEGDQPVAVIHRFEELPPGSTLIFYRYCDHENAAYKKSSLIFTVLLGEEEDLPVRLSLSVVEEMVDDHLQRKFLSSDHPTAFDKMDLDKYSGLWSRISHLILPVAAEKRIERHGC